jgi:serine/threonine-protein kinase SRPK3
MKWTLQLERIGVEDMPPPTDDDGPMIEPLGTRLEEEEIVLLSDLLEMMLKYRLEERMSIEEVVRYSIFMV